MGDIQDAFGEAGTLIERRFADAEERAQQRQDAALRAIDAGDEALRSRVEVLERAKHEHEAPVPPDPPTEPPVGDRDFSTRPAFRLEGLRDQVIPPFLVPSTPGDWALEVLNCHNLTFPAFEVNGGGVRVEGSSGIKFADGLINRNKLGRDGWSDEEVGFRVRWCRGVELAGSVVAYGDCNLRVEASQEVSFLNNFTYNPRGPMPRGQHFQSWEFAGEWVEDLLFDGHYALTDFYALGRSPEGEELKAIQEDAFNVSRVRGGVFRNGFHEMRGAEISPRATGSGFITEQSSTGIELRDYVFVGQANHGWSISGRAEAYLENVLSFFDGIGGARGTGKTAGVVRQAATVEFGPNVRCYGTKSRTDRYGAFWDARDGTTITGRSNLVTGTYESARAQAELAALVRPEIPAVGFELPRAA